MYSLNKIVEIVKEKVSGFNVRNTFPLTDEMIIDRINIIRELLIQQNKKKLQDSFYSMTCCLDVVCEGQGCVINDEFIESNVTLYSIKLPTLITGVGSNDIRYLGLSGLIKNFDRVSLDNFIGNQYSVWTGRRPLYTIIGEIAYLKNIPTSGLQKLCLVGLVKDPVSLCDYNKEESEYPVPQGYKLELLVTQDILSGLQIYPDELNDTRHQLQALRQGRQVPIEDNQQQEQQ